VLELGNRVNRRREEECSFLKKRTKKLLRLGVVGMGVPKEADCIRPTIAMALHA
jgi:hypothetical protein